MESEKQKKTILRYTNNILRFYCIFGYHFYYFEYFGLFQIICFYFRCQNTQSNLWQIITFCLLSNRKKIPPVPLPRYTTAHKHALKCDGFFWRRHITLYVPKRSLFIILGLRQKRRVRMSVNMMPIPQLLHAHRNALPAAGWRCEMRVRGARARCAVSCPPVRSRLWRTRTRKLWSKANSARRMHIAWGPTKVLCGGGSFALDQRLLDWVRTQACIIGCAVFGITVFTAYY